MRRLADLRSSASREPGIVNPRRWVALEVLEDLIDLLRDQRAARGWIEPERDGAAERPAELDEIRRLALHREQARVKCRVVASADQCEI